jgi:competence protein ComFC
MTALFAESKPRRWRTLFGRALDLLYPPVCALCRTGLCHGRALCETCDDDLPRISHPFCKSCGEPFPGEIDGPFDCPNCRNLAFAFAFARPAMIRDERTLSMIHRLKYARELHLAEELGRLATGAFADDRLAKPLAEKWPLVPVPLHRRRFQERHFNQSEEIARVVSRISGLPLLPALARIRPTEHQTILSRSERMENLLGAFAVTAVGQRHLKEKRPGAVLVDDVLTTGSTVHECAKILRRAGFHTVAVITVMRG